MKEYIYLLLFVVGFIWNLVARITFEKKKKRYDAAYISLYREHKTFLILLFLALSIDQAMKVLS